jgi:hypothetical protein
MRVLPPEVNHIDTYLAIGALSSSGITQQQLQLIGGTTFRENFTHINRGDGDNERVASKLKPLTLQGRVMVGALPDALANGTFANVAPTDDFFDFWVVLNKNPRGVDPSAANIFETNTGWNEPVVLRKHDEASEYRVLYHKKLHMRTALHAKTRFDGTLYRVEQHHFFEFFEFFLQLPPDLICTYRDAVSGEISNQIENSIHLFLGRNYDAGTILGAQVFEIAANFRLRFLDM